jgi:hemolysin III
MLNSNTKTEMANALSHGVGLLFTLMAAPVAIGFAIKNHPVSIVFAVAFYCFTMLLMFTFSTLYHAFQNPEAKPLLRIFDHISIFFLIGGSYTPFVVQFTSASTATWFLWLQWILIGLGILKKIYFTGQYRLLSSLVYIGIGSMVFLLGGAFWESLPAKVIILLALGGAFYLIGVIFYQNQKIPYNHFIWHVFVLVACIAHYAAVLLTVL